jgi:hypothetical protein
MDFSIKVNQDVTTFAERKGWTKTITEVQETAVHGRVKVEIDNPITAEQFVSDYFKKIVVNEFANDQIGLINEDFEAQKKTQIEAIQNQLNEIAIVQVN